jgi:hypothetical protein
LEILVVMTMMGARGWCSKRVNRVSCRLTVWAVLPLFIISLWSIFFFHVLGSRLGGRMLPRVPQDAGVASIEIIIACMN